MLGSHPALREAAEKIVTAVRGEIGRIDRDGGPEQGHRGDAVPGLDHHRRAVFERFEVTAVGSGLRCADLGYGVGRATIREAGVIVHGGEVWSC